MLPSWVLLVGTVALSTGYDFDYDIVPVAWCRRQCRTEEEDFYQDTGACEKECVRSYSKDNVLSCDNRIIQRTPGECNFECKSTSDCNDIDMCCDTPSCGMTCVSPDLTKYEDFPPIPVNLTIFEHKGKKAKLYWDAPQNNDTVYLIQSRQSIGCKYYENFMSEWHVVTRPLPNAPPAVLTLKPGFWFEIRLAAVNRRGTRGFSKPSAPFKLSRAPRPPGTPRNIKFTYGGVNTKKSKVWGWLEWNRPHSVVPIKKYVVYWSIRILPENRPSNRTSIFQKSKSVLADNAKIVAFKIRNLNPGLEYFLQVEAQMQCGKKRLSSQKGGIVLPAVNDINSLQLAKPSFRGKGLAVRVAKVEKKQGKISAKIVWAAKSKTKYAVSWSFDNFSNETIVLNESFFELENLHFNKLYNVTVIEQPRGKKYKRNGSAAFIADPDCPHVNRNKCS